MLLLQYKIEIFSHTLFQNIP